MARTHKRCGSSPLRMLNFASSARLIDANAGLSFSVFAGGTQADADGPARQVAVDLGNNIITIDAEGTEEWKALAEPIYADWVADMESKGIDGQALIDEARAKIAEYTK